MRPVIRDWTDCANRNDSPPRRRGPILQKLLELRRFDTYAEWIVKVVDTAKTNPITYPLVTTQMCGWSRWQTYVACLCAILAGVASPTPSRGDGDDSLIPQVTHPWGRCQPGSWKRVRVVTETLDGRGRVTGATATDTMSFLEEITESDFTLRVEVTVDVGGKRFTSQPQSVKQGYFGESPGQPVVRRKIRDEELLLGGRPLSVQSREITIQSEKQRRVTVSHFSEKLPPHVLRSVTTVTNGDGKTPTGSTQVEVIALDMPYRVLDTTRNVSFVRTVHHQIKGSTTVTLEAHCPDVPGGVVAHTSKEVDEAGQTVKRSTLELLEFGHGDAANVEVSGRRSRAQYRSRGRETVPNDRRRR